MDCVKKWKPKKSKKGLCDSLHMQEVIKGNSKNVVFHLRRDKLKEKIKDILTVQTLTKMDNAAFCQPTAS